MHTLRRTLDPPLALIAVLLSTWSLWLLLGRTRSPAGVVAYVDEGASVVTTSSGDAVVAFLLWNRSDTTVRIYGVEVECGVAKVRELPRFLGAGARKYATLVVPNCRDRGIKTLRLRFLTNPVAFAPTAEARLCDQPRRND